MLAAALMHTYSTGLPLKYSGTDDDFKSAIELGEQTARQLSFSRKPAWAFQIATCVSPPLACPR